MFYEEKGRADGETAGFQDGLDDKPKRPSPDLTPTLASIVYLEAYVAAYDPAYANGREARQTVLDWRANTEAVREFGEQTRDRGDV